MDLGPWDPHRVLLTGQSRLGCLSWGSGRARRPAWEHPSVRVTAPQTLGERPQDLIRLGHGRLSPSSL